MKNSSKYGIVILTAMIIICAAIACSYSSTVTEHASKTKVSLLMFKHNNPTSGNPTHVLEELKFSNGLPSYSNILATKSLLCLFEIFFFEGKVLFPEPHDIPLASTNLFRTLFKVIISSNAP